MKRGRILLAIGDPNGIGPEIAVKAARTRVDDPPVLIGDRCALETHAAEHAFALRDYVPDTPPADGVLDLVDTAQLPPDEYRPGVTSAEAGAATIAYVTTAVRMALNERFRGVVACPHSETAVHAAGIDFRGYPPLIAQLTGVTEDRVFLLLAGGGLRILHVTLHERLIDALVRLSPELVAEAGQALHDTLERLGIGAPQIGVFGINPHAGEGGLLAADDERVTVPAVASLTAQGIAAGGPAGADVLLATGGYDGFVAMYHDQGHIPVKLLAGTSATALAVGAGVPFCSVGHGTAFDIAGSGVANPAALIQALELLQPTKEKAA